MSVRKLDLSPLAALPDKIAPEKRVVGDPATGARPALENEAAGFYTGVWQSEPGAWRVAYDEDELCVLLEGQVRLTGEDGVAQDFGAGEAFTIARGFRGVWESVTAVRKIYAIAL
jgi:uncharacterized protein